MQVDYVLVLAAGKGTRMGKIGEKIPKVLWPIFSKSILELEVLYAKKICKKKVFVNVHHYKEKLKNHIENSEVFSNVEVLYEDDMIDIGGAIHNLARKVGYSGKLLVINSDQFIMLSNEVWQSFYDLSNKKDVVLLTYSVQGKDLYNATIVKNSQLKEVRKNDLMPREEFHETYTGVSIINLNKLDPVAGLSKYFDSVADYKVKDVGAINIDNSKYWDFGTIRRYYNSMFEILNKWSEDEPFINFLKENKVIDGKSISEKSYNSKINKVIDLADNPSAVSKTIYLNTSKVKVPEQDCIVLDDIIEPVDLPSL